MTSFAFILGVLPLALATGAGAAARNSVGTAVAGGMLASTFLSIFFIPVLYVVIRTLAPGRAHRDRGDEARRDVQAGVQPTWRMARSVAWLRCRGAVLFAHRPQRRLSRRSPTRLPPVETVTFDEAIARALEKNPTVAIAATNILRAEGVAAAGARAARCRAWARSITNTTLDSGRSFGDQTVQPRNQSLFGLVGVDAVLPPRSGRLRAQAMDQVEIARLSVTDTRRQIAVATASAYLAVIAQKRQVDVSLTAIETARGQLDYNTRRREGGVGSRLNELRSAQILAAHAKPCSRCCG